MFFWMVETLLSGYVSKTVMDYGKVIFCNKLKAIYLYFLYELLECWKCDGQATEKELHHGLEICSCLFRLLTSVKHESLEITFTCNLEVDYMRNSNLLVFICQTWVLKRRRSFEWEALFESRLITLKC